MDAVDFMPGFIDAVYHGCCPCGSMDKEDRGWLVVRIGQIDGGCIESQTALRASFVLLLLALLVLSLVFDWLRRKGRAEAHDQGQDERLKMMMDDDGGIVFGCLDRQTVHEVQFCFDLDLLPLLNVM